jgi:hypothetical protein
MACWCRRLFTRRFLRHRLTPTAICSACRWCRPSKLHIMHAAVPSVTTQTRYNIAGSSAEGGSCWRMDWAALEKTVEDFNARGASTKPAGSTTRPIRVAALLLCSPHNPTGKHLTRAAPSRCPHPCVMTTNVGVQDTCLLGRSWRS